MVRLLLLRFLSIVSECAARSYVLRCSVPGTRGYGILRYSLYRAPFVGVTPLQTFTINNKTRIKYQIPVARSSHSSAQLRAPTTAIEYFKERRSFRTITIANYSTVTPTADTARDHPSHSSAQFRAILHAVHYIIFVQWPDPPDLHKASPSGWPQINYAKYWLKNADLRQIK